MYASSRQDAKQPAAAASQPTLGHNWQIFVIRLMRAMEMILMRMTLRLYFPSASSRNFLQGRSRGANRRSAAMHRESSPISNNQGVVLMKALLFIFAAVLGITPTVQAATLYSCPNSPGGAGDRIDRGFYVTNYPGATLDTITLTYYASSGNGQYTISLTPHLSTYDGAVVGSTQQQTVALNSATGTPVTFHFGNAAVALGSTVAFTQTVVSGPGNPPLVNYDVGTTTPACPDVFETGDTAPPLGTPPIRRNTVGLTITGAPALPPPPLPQMTVSAPTLGIPGLALMIGALLSCAFLRVKPQKRYAED